MRTSLYLAVACLGLTAGFANASNIDPWSFNVVSLGNIGTSSNGYSSDFQGSAAVLGNAYFSGFSLHDVASAGVGTAYSLYAGGNVKITGSINNGGIDAGGNVYINGATVNGQVNAGGNLYGSGGSINGSLTLGGSKTTGYAVTVNGSVTTNTTYSPSLDITGYADYFRTTSQNLGAMANNNTVTNQWGGLSVTLHSGVNVVSISSSALRNAWGFTVNGTAGASLIINVTDSNVSLDSTTWVYNNVDAGSVLLNMPNANSLALTSGNIINLLAPNAATNFTNGALTGNLIVGSLTGNGQVNAGSFNLPDSIPAFNPGGSTSVPEPASIAMIALGGLLMTRHRKKA